MVPVDAVVPYARGELVSRARTSGEVSEAYTEGGVRISGHLPEAVAAEITAAGEPRAPSPSGAGAADRLAMPIARLARTTDAPVVLEGRVSIEAALTGGVRQVTEILAVTPGDRRLAYLRRLAAEHEVPIRRVAPGVLRGLVTGQTHGGVVALAGERTYQALPDLLRDAGPDAFRRHARRHRGPLQLRPGRALPVRLRRRLASSCAPVHGNPQPRP